MVKHSLWTYFWDCVDAKSTAYGITTLPQPVYVHYVDAVLNSIWLWNIGALQLFVHGHGVWNHCESNVFVSRNKDKLHLGYISVFLLFCADLKPNSLVGYRTTWNNNGVMSEFVFMPSPDIVLSQTRICIQSWYRKTVRVLWSSRELFWIFCGFLQTE